MELIIVESLFLPIAGSARHLNADAGQIIAFNCIRNVLFTISIAYCFIVVYSCMAQQSLLESLTDFQCMIIILF